MNKCLTDIRKDIIDNIGERLSKVGAVVEGNVGYFSNPNISSKHINDVNNLFKEIVVKEGEMGAFIIEPSDSLCQKYLDEYNKNNQPEKSEEEKLKELSVDDIEKYNDPFEINNRKEELENPNIFYNKIPSSKEAPNLNLNEKINKFLEKIGVSVQSVKVLRDQSGLPLPYTAVADLLNKTIHIVEGRDTLDILPEEAAHFYVEMLGEEHPLFKEMFSRITNYQIYKDTVEQYRNNKDYRIGKTLNGPLDIYKLKKEAIGKVIAQHIIKSEPGTETDENLISLFQWWRKLWEWIKSVFSKVDENPFDIVAKDITEGDTSKLVTDKVIDELYFNMSDPMQGLLEDQSNIKLDDSIDPKTGQKRHIYTYKGERAKGSVTSMKVDAWLKRIFKTDNRAEIQIKIDLLKAEYGDIIHSQIDKIIKAYTTPEGYLREDEDIPVERVDGLSDEHYSQLFGYVAEVMSSYDTATTRFFSEVRLFDKKNNMGGSIDLLVLQQDDTVDIWDWKSQETFFKQTDIKTYKEPMYRIQLGEYKRILQKQYGFTKFGKIRAIPISTKFTIKNGIPTSIKSLEIGSLDINEIPDEKSYLLPVALRTESTGNEQLDELLDKLNALYDRIDSNKNKGNTEQFLKRKEELLQYRSAIRDLQLKNQVEKFIKLGLTQYKKYYEKVKNNTLQGKDIIEAMDIINVFSESSVMLSDLREKMRNEVTDEEKLKEFDKYDRDLILMSGRMSGLRNTLETYRQDMVKELSEKKGIFDILKPEKIIGTLSGWFSSFSNIQQKSFQLVSKLLREVQSIRNTKSEEDIKKLTELKKNFLNWASSKGLSSQQALDMMLNIDDKGNWNGDFLNVYQSEFYKLRKEAVEKVNVDWLLENCDWDEDKYEEAEKRQIKFFNDIVFDSDEDLNKLNIKKKIDEWILNHKIMLDEKINYVALFNLNNRFLKPMEKWQTDKWKELAKPENKPLKDVYDYFQSSLRRSEKLGMLDSYSTHFIPSMIASKIDQLSFGNLSSLFDVKGALKGLEVDSGNQYTPQTNPINGQIINSLPVYYTTDLGVEKEDGSIDYSRKSKDLFKVFGIWNMHTNQYEAMQTIENDVLNIIEIEKGKKRLVTNSFGEVSREDGEAQDVNDNSRNAKLLEEFAQYYLYDRMSDKLSDSRIGKYSGLKLLNSAIRFFSLKTLALNPISGTAAFVGGTGNALFNAKRGIFFTTKSWVRSYQNMGTAKGRAALKYLNILQENGMHSMVDDLSLSGANKVFKHDNFYVFQRVSDKAVQYPIALTLMENHMLDEKGNIVDITQYVKNKYNYNTEYYSLNSSQRSEIRKKINKEVGELQKTKSLYAISKIDDKGNFEIPGVDKKSETYIAFTDKIRAVNKKIIGNNTREDINAIRTTMLGSALMQFRNWIPEMVEDRFAGLKYDAELGTWTYGKMKMTWNAMWSKKFPILIKSLILGFGDSGIQMAKDSYQKIKMEALEQGIDFDMTEGEFIDMYIGNLRSTMSEITVMIGFWALILSVGSTGDDDDKKGMKQYMSRALGKYFNEFAFYYNPLEFTRLVNNPLPVIGLAEDFSRFNTAIIKESYGRITGDEEITESAKPSKYFTKMVPVAKEAMMVFAAYDDDFRKDWDISLQWGGAAR